MTLAPAWGAVTASKQLSDGTQFTVDGGTLRVQFWSPEIIRVTYVNAAELPTNKSLSVVASPEKVKLTQRENDQAFTLASADIKVRIDKQTGTVSFLDAAGRLLLRETADGRKIAPATQAASLATLAPSHSRRRQMKAFTAWASTKRGRGITALAVVAASGLRKPTPT